MAGTSRLSRWSERAFWRVQSCTWDDLLQKPRHVERLRAVVEIVAGEVRPGERVLDIGCGTGTYAVALARSGLRVVGVDFSPPMLRRARAKARQIPSADIRFERADFNHPLPFADGEFDHAICVCALHCVRDTAAFFSEVHRLVRPGGRFLLVALAGEPDGRPGTRLRTSAPRRAFWRVKRRMAESGRWARHRRSELLALLDRAGFEPMPRAEEPSRNTVVSVRRAAPAE